MKRTLMVAAVMTLLPVYVFAVDGVILINQSTVMAAGGFPYVISQPGSYKLSGNLTVPAATGGIVILSSYVTLDLNGFAISAPGVPPGGVATFGIIGDLQTSITVRNGSINGFFIPMTVSSTHVLVEDMLLIGGGGFFGGPGIVRHVISDGRLVLTCPVLAVENVTPQGILRESRSPTDCFVLNNIGPIM
jgi:hypothetical protein